MHPIGKNNTINYNLGANVKADARGLFVQKILMQYALIDTI